MNDSTAKARPSPSQSHGKGLNGACSAPCPERAASATSDDGADDPTSRRVLSPTLCGCGRSAGAGTGDGETGLNAANGEPVAAGGASRFSASERLAVGAPVSDVAPLLAASSAGADGAGAAAGALPALVSCGNEESTAEARNRKSAAPLAKVDSVRSGATQIGIDTRGTSDRDGTGIGRAAMSRAVPRSSARRVRQRAHVSRCACTEARAWGESASSRYAERSSNGCTALISYP